MGHGIDHRNDNMKLGVFLLQPHQRLAEHGKHAAHFAGAAAGQYGKDRRVGRKAMACPERRAVAAFGADIDGRVADIGAGDAEFGEERHLEGQQRHDVIDPLLELAGAERTPGPKLGRDIMDYGDAGAAQMMGEPQAEARRVHGHDRVGLEPAHRSGRFVEASDDARQMGQHFGEPHHRQIAHGKQALEPLALALRTADAGKADAPARLALERGHQPAGEIVAGRLARNDKDQRLTPVHADSH